MLESDDKLPQLHIGTHSRSIGRIQSGAFTLPEVMVGSAIVAIVVLSNMVAIYASRIMSYKDSEAAIVSGFMQHYSELVKALPFDQVMTNQPLSGLYSGLDNTPRIALPPDGNWSSINTTSYQTFQPSLVWITNRSPTMRVVIETSYQGAIAHDKHILIEVQWDPPLLVGSRLYRRLDLFRVKDL